MEFSIRYPLGREITIECMRQQAGIGLGVKYVESEFRCGQESLIGSRKCWSRAAAIPNTRSTDLIAPEGPVCSRRGHPAPVEAEAEALGAALEAAHARRRAHEAWWRGTAKEARRGRHVARRSWRHALRRREVAHGEVGGEHAGDGGRAVARVGSQAGRRDHGASWWHLLAGTALLHPRARVHLVKTWRALSLENLGRLLGWPAAVLIAVLLQVRLIEECWQSAWSPALVLRGAALSLEIRLAVRGGWDLRSS